MVDYKSNIKKVLPNTMKLLHSIRMWMISAIGVFSPTALIGKWYYLSYHEKINLKNPSTIDEKINWLKLHSDTSIWSYCADKVLVRNYVSEKGLGFTLNEIYGCFYNVDEKTFDLFPDKLVIKSNNGGGGNNVVIITDRKQIDNKIIKKINKWMNHKPSNIYYEPHYQLIKPQIIVEKYISPNENESFLIDIKINCINGKPHSILLCSDRMKNGSVKLSVYDLDWKLRKDCIISEFRTEKIYPRPTSFDKILEYSEKLAEGIPFVRVDWYEVDGQPVFSEMTFTPAGGFTYYYSQDFSKEMGALIVLPEPIH